MKRKQFLLLVAALAVGVLAAFIVVSTLASTSSSSETPSLNSLQDLSDLPHSGVLATASLSLTFPTGNYPWYAHNEIIIRPEPPLVGRPTEICVEVINLDRSQQHFGLLQFGVAGLGIGLPVNPIGAQEVSVPPGGTALSCIVWVPPNPGSWGVEVLLFQHGADDPIGIQRNVDINEPLRPNTPHERPFTVRNPFNQPVTITLGLVNHLPDWSLELSPSVLTNMSPGEARQVVLTVTPPTNLPPDGMPILDMEAYVQGELVGGLRKIFRPPVYLRHLHDLPYAEPEINVQPYPLHQGEPTEICVELYNPTPDSQRAELILSWSEFGIGMPVMPIGGPLPVSLPPESFDKKCIVWIPPINGEACLHAELVIPGYPSQHSQRNIDVGELLEPDIPHARLIPIRNPLSTPVTITLGMDRHLPDWGIQLSPNVLTNVPPGGTREVLLTVTPTVNLPPDEHPVVDVEAYANHEFIGGVRKIFRPPVPVHQPVDPIYAESEIFINPYPPRPGEPTEIAVDLRNPTDQQQTLTVTFSVANFGIGLPFHSIARPRQLALPANSIVRTTIVWVPPFGGLFCVQVDLYSSLGEALYHGYSQRNIDVGEPLQPNIPHARQFMVGNPLNYPVTLTLGMVPHLPDWGLELSQDVILNLEPGALYPVTLTVTPPSELPPDGEPIVDVEAYVARELIGGFRKIFRPPVPVHRPKDPPYAESEIFVDPYPTLPGLPTILGVEVSNPTPFTQLVTATFSVAPFGIGLPFNSAGITPASMVLNIPPNGMVRGKTLWKPPDFGGKFCVRVTLQSAGHEPVWSQRNIDVGEPLAPGVPHTLEFPVGSWPYTKPVTIALAMLNYRPDWQVRITPEVLHNVQPFELVPVSLTVTPTVDAELGTTEPILDLEAYVNGELLGGIRKLDIPPVPLHKPHEKGYAESEIVINPEPPQQGKLTSISTLVYNTSDSPMTIDLEFGWAQFGMGIPFTSTGISPPTRTVHLAPGANSVATVSWTPVYSGSQCVFIRLSDPQGIYEPQESQRNVHVEPAQPCAQPFTKLFLISNSTSSAVTVTIGSSAINLPPGWNYTVAPQQVELGPYQSATITVTLYPPCPKTAQEMRALQEYSMSQQSGSVGIIDVEGYIDGGLVGGIEIMLPYAAAPPQQLYLPLVRK